MRDYARVVEPVFLSAVPSLSTSMDIQITRYILR